MSYHWHTLDFEKKKRYLRFVKISFDTPVFDKVTKDRSAKFVDMLSAIGGTMGLLTGFSILSGVEIIYFGVKIVNGFIKKKIYKISRHWEIEALYIYLFEFCTNT